MKSKGGRIALSVLAGLLPVVFGVGLLIAPSVVAAIVFVAAVASLCALLATEVYNALERR